MKVTMKPAYVATMIPSTEKIPKDQDKLELLNLNK